MRKSRANRSPIPGYCRATESHPQGRCQIEAQHRRCRSSGKSRPIRTAAAAPRAYTLEKAEENYTALVQLEHLDANENSPESNAATAELNEAFAFFRDTLGS
jgi:hypothetical protein